MKSAVFFSSTRIHCKLNNSFDLMPLFCHYPTRIKIGIRFCSSMTPFSGETVPLMGLVDDNPPS